MKVRPVAIIWCAIVLHLLWGCLLLVNDKALGATALHAFAGMPRQLTAAILFVVAGLAAVGVVRPHSRTVSLALLLPQQAVLSISAMSAILAVIDGQYGDGVSRPWYFILADQAPVILTMVLHTIAVVQLHMAPAPAPDPASRPDGELHAKLVGVQEEAEQLRRRLAERRGELSGGEEAVGRDRNR
ncbi:MAG TPA: hypothetical protein VFU43_24700 [Streptosporangiaceae bacterium]|nr:hypothetical protein [Streptosporangiaceae bacterium]